MTEGPVDDTERAARMTMSRIVEPGDPDACRLVHEHSAAALIERLPKGEHGTSKLTGWAARLPGACADRLAEQAAAVGARYLCPGDGDWPPGLEDLDGIESSGRDRRGGRPFGLWVRGDLPPSAWARAVSVVGARSATAYGEQVAGDLAMTCAAAGWLVVSGGAYGIDAAAHRGALAAGRPTVAVLAGGIDRLYPAAHLDLLTHIERRGLLLSEAAPGGSPSRSRFLVRNRLIAAITAGTVVVEAALRSGSLNTARWARDLNRHVLGVPGPVTSELSAGVHEMLRQHPEAVLVTAGADVVEQLSPIGEGLAPARSGVARPRDHLDPAAARLLDAVPLHEPVSARAIAYAGGVTLDETHALLAVLHRAGMVVLEPTGWRLAPLALHGQAPDPRTEGRPRPGAGHT